MASESKRARLSVDTASGTVQSTKLELNSFIKWCQDSGFNLSPKVEVTSSGTSCHAGMLAVEDIKEGERLFEVPRRCLLKPETSVISDLLSSDGVKSKSGWVPLLLSLMHETANPNSKWRPYLDAFPNFKDVELPMFWPEEFRAAELKGTGVDKAVERDIGLIRDEYNNVVLPFVDQHSNIFQADCCSLDYYKKMVAFVMAYSFTEPVTNAPDDKSSASNSSDEEEDDAVSPPMMVPMADILNHVAMHNAQLSFGKNSLTMVATKDIFQGEEIFNTYGRLSNAQLLHMYGFCEPPGANINDTVDFMAKSIYNAYAKQCPKQHLEERWKLMEKMGLVTEEAMFSYGADGFLEDDLVANFCKVLSMTDEAFAAYNENSGWESDEDDNADIGERFTNGGIAGLSKWWRSALLSTAKDYALGLASCTDKDDELIKMNAGSSSRDQLGSRKQLYCAYLRHGQRRLLSRLIAACQGTEII